MTDPLTDALRELQQEYLAEAPARLAEFRKDIAALGAGEADAPASLKTRFHRLAGSGGSYGFPELSELGRSAELWLETEPEWTEANLARLNGIVDRIAAAFDQGARGVGSPTRALLPQEFGWRATIVGADDAALFATVEEALGSAGFLVSVGNPEDEPHAVPLSERPDLVVILGGSMALDAYSLAAAWSGWRATRPRAIVLIDPTREVDRLRAVASGLDAIYHPEQVAGELPKYAKTLARIGAPPSSVLLVEDDPEQAASITACLETANIRVLHCAEATAAREVLEHEVPDLVLLDVQLPGVDGFTLARLIRQDPRFHLIPVVFITALTSVNDQIEALRAGADDFMIKPVDQSLLLHAVITRAERGRRIREMVHRDGLTGLLNHATLMAELEHSIPYARRMGEPFAFLMIDIDHFKRVNDRYGHLVGDQVLLNVARLFQRTARASDLIGRYGGEEFGMILRRTGRDGAEVFAGKLRTALRDHPARTADGESVPVRVSIGIALFPGHGTSASEIANAADKALYRAKTGGRDRVEVADD